MGCASSTPMIATAGSDILKAATHAASDAAKGAEHAVEEVAENVGKTLENTKESVGTAVTGIAHDLGNVFTEKTGELDTAKNQLLERLHLGGATKTLEHSSEATLNQLDTTALEAVARAPTPPPDLDSLKTSTPEPEIEQAMANSREDAPPTPKPTIAELEKLTAEVKQTTTAAEAAAVAAKATTVTEGHIVERNRAPAEVSSGTTAATEPAVDAVAWLVAEKRPGTTDWERHADHLSKTRKMSEFKGGGKFRRFGPAIAPLNYPKPIENINMNRALLEDDSCFSDAYYNSQSSPTNSDSPKVRRARLPINGVLATNAKRMQREFATFVSNRRSAASVLRSLTVSPALGRRFDYNPQRARITSPTPSLIGYVRSSYSPPVLVNPELLLNARTTNWKKGLASALLVSPPQPGAHAPQVTEHLDSPLTGNVIPQTKLTSTKAFAPLRGEKGRSRIFGQTRTGSPVNRRVFATRSMSPRKDKASARYIRSGSAEQKRALIQAKVEAGRKIEADMPAPKPTIKLEREASVRENKVASVGELPEGGFSLSKALSPIKLAAETHSLPHLKNEATKKGTKSHSMLEVVEQAVERARNGGHSMKAEEELAAEENEGRKQVEKHRDGIKKMATEIGTPKTSEKNERKGNDKNKQVERVKHGTKESITKPRTAETSNMSKKNGVDNKVVETNNVEHRQSFKNIKTSIKEGIKDDGIHKKSQKWSPGMNSTPARSRSSTANSKESSCQSMKQSAGSWRESSNSRSPTRTREKDATEKHKNKDADLELKSGSPSNDIEGSLIKNLAVKGRFSMSPSKKENLNYDQNEKQHSTWVNSSSEYRAYLSGHSTTGRITPNIQRNPQKSPRGIEKHSPILKTTPINKEYHEKSSGHESQSNWKNPNRRNSQVDCANMTQQYENCTKSRVRSKNSSPCARQKIVTSESDETTSMEEEKSPLKTYDKIKTPDLENVPRTSLNNSHANNWIEKDRHSKAGNYISPSHSTTAAKTDKRKITQPQEVYGIPSPTIKSMQCKNYVNNNYDYKLQTPKNFERIEMENLCIKDNQINNCIKNAQSIQKTNNLTHQLITFSPTKDHVEYTNSPTRNSYHSSPSKSSNSSTSIVICTNLSTPDTEEHSEGALNAEITRALQQLEQCNEAPEDEGNSSIPNSCSIDDNSKNDLDDSLHSNHEDSSRTDNEEIVGTDMELSYHADVEITSVSSIDDLINMLSPEVAYLNLGRSATMMTLRATTPVFNASSSFHSTPHGSPSRQRHGHYSFNDSDGLEKVPFIAEFSSLARSRSPQVPPSPYKMRARCSVCFNKYVIK